ncbi:MAG: hypothetical protein KY438_02325, partial [Actinobacteria bacterium]|nr:hypothetical protein [Actinomycetota bacterium]
MLVLISFGLLLVALVLLVLGLISGSGLGLIIASIVSSVLAGIVLLVSTVTRRPDEETRPAAAPAPSPVQERQGQEAPTISYAPVSAASEPADEPTAPVPVAASPTYTPAARRPALATVGAPAPGSDSDDDFFPIEDYDELKVSEILPLVPELYPDELDMVEARERATKGRITVLNRIDEVRRRMGDTATETAVPEQGDVVLVGAVPMEAVPMEESTTVSEEDDDVFPIEDYDELTVGEIMPLLPELYPDELDVVERRERAGRGRVAIINGIAELRQTGAMDEAGAAPLAGGEDEGEVDGPVGALAEDDFFPIEDYDELTVGEVLPLLPELYPDELDVVEERERATRARPVVLARLAELREGADSGVAAVDAGDEDEARADDDFFPIEDYDELTVGEVLPLLPELYPEDR